MAAGISKEEKHRIERRLLKGMQRDLTRQGIEATYSNRCLSGTHEGKDWHVAYDWLHASNGECCGMPHVVVAGRSVVHHFGVDVVETLVEHIKGQVAAR